MSQDPASGVSVVSSGGAFTMNFEALRPVMTRPHHVVVEGGSDPWAWNPSASLGIAAATGSLKMKGPPMVANNP